MEAKERKRIDKKTGKAKGGHHRQPGSGTRRAAKGLGGTRGGGGAGNANSLANLKPHHWKPGQSGNPSGTSSSIQEIMRLSRDLTPATIMVLNEIVHDKTAHNRDRIMAAVAIGDRGCGRPPQAVFDPSSVSPMVGLDEENTVLIIAAARAKGPAGKQKLLDELRRIEKIEAQAKADHEDRHAEARAAQARGEEIDGMSALLIAARAAPAADSAVKTAAPAAPAGSAPSEDEEEMPRFARN